MRAMRSVSIETAEGEMITWAFLGLDGSLKTLHVEEQHRSQGLAKSIAIKLFHDAKNWYPEIFGECSNFL
ncbi:hypothetical protein HYALB_00004782 [Hymenoscyphus albidus]|uniref:Uncharacterized protein n=1 Tax=Hymenoscyphus albidus TaxID=595503 RepID=A0A9N9Q6F0_9HELO|nr:hypothetical protein HYALB_00004782 [Hymenoscyphus albidus]